MRVRIKICGITNLRDANLCIREGVDALGFVFYPQSPRYIDICKAMKISHKVPPFVSKVGVFVNESIENILSVVDKVKLDVVQLHGEETPHFVESLKKYVKVIKAVHIKDRVSLEKINRFKADAILLDSFHPLLKGGSGRSFNWNYLKNLKQTNIIVSGGLNPYNVVDLFKYFIPWGVDVSSGVEKHPGKKDSLLVRMFIKNIRRWENEIAG